MLQLSKDEKQALLDAARRSVTAFLRDGAPAPVVEPSNSPAPVVGSGIFVSIHKQGKLRGCIGRVETEQTLVEAAARHAISAAIEDPRFPPLELEELDEVVFEISVLTPIQPVASIDAIRIGVHGLLIESGQRRGLLLPQVAVEHGWDRTEFLRQAAIKAGLDPEAWRGDARVSVFEALVFGERQY